MDGCAWRCGRLTRGEDFVCCGQLDGAVLFNLPRNQLVEEVLEKAAGGQGDRCFPLAFGSLRGDEGP